MEGKEFKNEPNLDLDLLPRKKSNKKKIKILIIITKKKKLHIHPNLVVFFNFLAQNIQIFVMMKMVKYIIHLK